MEPIPAQLPEQQKNGLAINIDEFKVELEIPDLYAQENLFNFQVEENPSNNGIFLPGYNGALEPEIQGNGGWLPEVKDSVEEEQSEIQGVPRGIQPLYHVRLQAHKR